MRYIKVGGATALAVVALIAFVGAGSASADTFCSANVNACPPASQYPLGTALSAHANDAVLTAGPFEVTCESDVSGSVTENPGVGGGPVEGTFVHLTFTNCGGSCETAVAQNLPYNAEAEATGEGDGVVRATNSGAGEPGATLGNCLGLGVNCTYATEGAGAELRFEGGNPAFVFAEEVPLEETAGLCPANGTWTAAYEVQEPQGELWLEFEP